MGLTVHELAAAWLMFAAGFLTASVVVLIGAAIGSYTEGRVVGARHGGRRPDAGCREGSCRRGDGSPRRIYRDEIVEQFLAGMITLDDVRDFYHGRKE
jgi:hypothetical protein